MYKISTEVTVAFVTVFGVIMTALLAIINTAFTKKLGHIEEKKEGNDLRQVENNILAQLIPVLERKDIAIDRVADILEVYGRRIDLMELGQKNFTSLLLERCQAPKLLEELKHLQDATKEKREREQIITALMENCEEGGA